MATKTLTEGLWVLDPTTVPETVPVSMARRLDTLEGKVMGVLDNSKQNADRVLALVTEMLKSRYKLGGVVQRRKAGAGRGATDEMLDEIAEECQFAVVGVGD